MLGHTLYPDYIPSKFSLCECLLFLQVLNIQPAAVLMGINSTSSWAQHTLQDIPVVHKFGIRVKYLHQLWDPSLPTESTTMEWQKQIAPGEMPLSSVTHKHKPDTFTPEIMLPPLERYRAMDTDPQPGKKIWLESWLGLLNTTNKPDNNVYVSLLWRNRDATLLATLQSSKKRPWWRFKGTSAECLLPRQVFIKFVGITL